MPTRNGASRMAVLVAVLLVTACGRQQDSDYGPMEPDSGTDADTDADADADADTGTETCLEGSYTIENSLDATSLQPFTCITGDLAIEAPGLTEVGLPNLEWIGGDLVIRYNDDLAGLELGDLETVGGDLELVGNPALVSVEGLGQLGSVGGRVIVDSDDSLPDLSGLAGLVAVGGDFKVQVNDSLTTVGLGALASVGGSVHIGLGEGAGNPVIETLGLPELTSIGGSLAVMDNGKLPCCEVCELLEQLSEPPSQLYVTHNLADECWSGTTLTCP